MMSNTYETLEKIAINASVLLTFIFLFHWLYPLISKLSKRWVSAIFGVWFGMTGLAVMLDPLYIADGVIVDFRTVLVALAGTFGGSISGILAMLIVGGYRAYLGGAGIISGVGGIVTAMVLGVLMNRYEPRFKKPTLAYAVFGVIIALESAIWFLVLPKGLDQYLIQHIAIYMIMTYPLVVIIIRYFITHEIRKKETEGKLLESEEQYRTLVEHSNDLIFRCDLRGNLLSANKKFMDDLGIEAKELKEQWVFDVLGFRDDLARWQELLTDTVYGKRPVTFEKEVAHKDGSTRLYVTTLSPVLGADQQVKSITGTCYDITRIRNSERRILQLSLYDALTELPNRRLLMEKLNQAITVSQEQGTRLAVVVADLDNFKLINDTRGYAFGDELLNRVGQQLQRLVSPKDTLARIGEDEFVLLLEGFDQLHHLLSRIQTIQDEFQYPQFIRNEQIYTKMSLGIALYPGDGDNAEELIKNADTAMYNVKSAGKNHYRFYNMEMREALLKRGRLEEALRKALIHNELILQFQPQKDLRTNRIRGFEALIRWVHPQMGTVSPMDFIPVAEQSGAIIPIGEWVIRTACERNKVIQKNHFPNSIISVNISAIQLQRPDFAQMVIDILLETRLAPKYLELEITESIMMESFQSAIGNLQTLRDYGVSIALDDFGTGYSSLSYLKQLPIRTLKIDKSFIKDITRESVTDSLVESIIILVHRMGMEVVAEGVETQEQLDFLRQWGCEYVQGFLISKPLFELEIRQLSVNKQPDTPSFKEAWERPHA
ncbi:EAL domain-containing protein [Paenibacillus sp. 32352]|uniref:EAL domain-containing protein n=1 Tax=Paenibacillus sp. 32352 TaxID=1969111 RepID=UPI0009AE434D|nr:EAL domain-containing protein [Paenibacillus sp. 32352]